MKFQKLSQALLLACAVLFSALVAHSQGTNISGVALRPGVGISGVNVAVCAPLATTAASVTSNLATLTMASNPQTAGYIAGMVIQVAGFTGGDVYLNGGTISNGQIANGFTILSVTATQIVYALVHANATASTNGTVLQQGNATTSCAALSSTFTDATLTTPAANPTLTDNLGNFNTWAAGGQYQIQYYSATVPARLYPAVTVSTGVSASANNTFTGTNQFNSNVLMKGPVPWADITANGARAGTGNATITQTNSGTPNVTLSTGGGFQNGDGVVLPGVGAVNAMTTPVAPTVTPSIAEGPTGTELDVNSPTGASTYNYCYFAIDKNENVTACSPTTTIANGLASLGTQTATLTTYSRSNDTATYNTSAANNLVTNAYVDIIPNSPQFTGWYEVCSTPSNTQFTVCGTPVDTRIGVNQVSDVGTATVSGGTVAWVQDNKVVLTAVAGAWLYGVCAQRPGDVAFHLIGLTKPQGPGSLTDLQFDDYGATYHGNQTYPSWLSDSNCTGAASTNGLLSTTIVSGGGTTSIVLAANANATVTSGTMNLDACPGIKAAANVAIQTGLTGSIYIPPTSNAARSYPIKSYCVIPTSGSGNVSIKMAGALSLDQTIQFQGNTNIDGSFSESATPQFGNYAGASISVSSVLPGIYFTGQGNYLSMANVSGGSQNGDMLIVSDNANGLTLDGVNCVSAGQSANDLLGMCMLNRDNSGTVVDLTVRNSLFSGGPTQTTDLSWTPLVWQKTGTFYNSWTHNNNNRRGVYFANGGSIDVKWYYSQGLINPQFTLFPNAVGVSGRWDTIYHDTDGQPTLSNIGNQPLGYYYLKLVAQGSNPPNPVVSGARPVQLIAEHSFYNSGLDVLPNRGVCKTGYWTTPAYPWDTSGSYFASNEAMTLCSEPIGITSGSAIFWAMAPPTAITSANAGGGSVPVSASGWVYSVSATGPDGGETVLQPVPSAACVTSGGNQTCNIGYTGVAGASSYNVYRCDKSVSTCTTSNLGGIIGQNASWGRVVLHTTANPYSDTSATSTAVPSLPSVTATGYPEITNVGVYSPLVQTPSLVMPGATSGTITHAAPAVAGSNTITDPAVTGTTGVTTGTLTNGDGIKIDASGRLIDSGTSSFATVEYCGATSGATQNCAKTVQTLPIIVWGDVTLNTATTQSITTLPFTDALYSCSGSDLTTPAGVVSFSSYAAASVTIQETGGVNTDHLRYQCVGH